MNRVARLAVGATFLTVLCGCATTSGVVVSPTPSTKTFKTAYLVVHGDRSSDMDALIQKHLLARGISVSVGPELSLAQDAEVIVRYADDWKWDLKMYLWSFNLMVSDAKTNVLEASGSWRNSAMHGFYDEDKVIGEVVANTLGKLAAQ